VPIVLDIADAARKYARPEAWIVDFTNPVGIVTRALLDEGHRAMGLCNVAIGCSVESRSTSACAPSRSSSTTPGSTT